MSGYCPDCGNTQCLCTEATSIGSSSPEANGSVAGTIRNVGRGPDGRAFVVYLRDNIRISVGRTMDTKGPAWIEITETPIVGAQNEKGKR